MSEEQQLSEAQLELRLEEARTKRLELEQQAATAAERAAAAQEERRQIAFHTNLERAIVSTGLKTLSAVDQREFIDVVKSFLKFDIKSDGSFDVIDAKGRPVEFDSAFREFAIARSVFFDGRSLRALQTPPDELCKSEMTNAQKSAFIQKHGLILYEALPTYRPTKFNLSTLNGEQYSKLSPAQKSAIVAKIGETGVSEILRRR